MCVCIRKYSFVDTQMKYTKIHMLTCIPMSRQELVATAMASAKGHMLTRTCTHSNGMYAFEILIIE